MLTKVINYFNRLIGNDHELPALTQEFKNQLRQLQLEQEKDIPSLYVALDKRKALLTNGCPRHALKIVMAKSNSKLHCSLLVHTRQGIFVLDSTQNDIVKLSKFKRKNDWNVLSVVL